MRQMFRALGLLVALVVLLPAATSQPAAAFGDTCYRDVRAKGSVQGSMTSARAAASSAWEAAAAKRYGRQFGNWWYSADRAFDCSWDNSGRRIQCTAIAGPCARKR
jgi:hypothetical protein